jgi:hypothetical protein
VGLAALERIGVKRWLVLTVALGLAAASLAATSDQAAATEETPRIVVVVGAPGQKEYGQSFDNWARLWEKSCQAADAQTSVIGLDQASNTNDLDRLQALLKAEPHETSRELWLIFLGHGTFDGKEAKFNLRGPDLSATELAAWLEPFHRPLAVINTASASGPFLKKLSGTSRVVITATRSGYEQNYARFGQFFSAAISDPKADLDKDGQVSLLEAFLMASHQVAEFYKTQGRLATEHALLDDNGDGLGTPPDWFRGIRSVKKPAEGSSLDGLRAHQFHLLRSEAERKLSPALRARRNELEVAIETLRQSKQTLPTDEYYQRLEVLMLDLARLYERSESSSASE